MDLGSLGIAFLLSFFVSIPELVGMYMGYCMTRTPVQKAILRGVVYFLFAIAVSLAFIAFVGILPVFPTLVSAGVLVITMLFLIGFLQTVKTDQRKSKEAVALQTTNTLTFEESTADAVVYHESKTAAKRLTY